MAHLTTAGQSKLNRMLELAQSAITDNSFKAVNKIIKPAVLKNTPSHKQEEELVSIGTFRGDSLGEGGLGDHRHFHKSGSQKYFKDAVRNEVPHIESSSKEATIQMGFRSRLNAITGFSYISNPPKDSGAVGGVRRSLPFNRDLAGSLEYGGSWNVTPRPETFLLVPEKGVAVPRMAKTIKPVRMYHTAAVMTEKKLKDFFTKVTKKEVRKA